MAVVPGDAVDADGVAAAARVGAREEVVEALDAEVAVVAGPEEGVEDGVGVVLDGVPAGVEGPRAARHA